MVDRVVASASLVVLVIRTRRPIFRSAPSWKLLTATVLVVAVVIVLPFTPLSGPAWPHSHTGGLLRSPRRDPGSLRTRAEIAKWLFYRVHERPAAGGTAGRSATSKRRPSEPGSLSLGVKRGLR